MVGTDAEGTDIIAALDDEPLYTPAELRERRDGPVSPVMESRCEMMLAVSVLLERGKAQKNRGGGLFDFADEESDESVKPVLPPELSGSHGDYDASDYDGSGYRYAVLPRFQLAWLVWACREYRVPVFLKDGKPRTDFTRSAVAKDDRGQEFFKARLGAARDTIAARLSSGKKFDCREWQIELVFADARGWQVWGHSSETGQGHRLHDGKAVPPEIDRITIWRRGAWRALPNFATDKGSAWVRLPPGEAVEKKSKK